MKKPSRKTLIRKLDKLWSELVKLRAGYRCQRCGGTHSLQSHHICGRRKYSVRWILLNGICLCSACHILVQENYLEASELVAKILTLPDYHFLKEQARKIARYSNADLEEIYLELSKLIKTDD